MRFDQYKALVFDLDGTLVDTMPLHLKAWEITAREFNFEFDKDWLHSLGGIPTFETVECICSHLQIELDIDKVKRFKTDAYHTIRSELRVIQDTYKLIVDNNYKRPVGVATGSSRAGAVYALEKTGIDKFIDAMVCSDDVNIPKPHPETYTKVAFKLGVSPSDCLAFEDTKIGYDSATQAGMKCLMVIDGVIEGS